LLNKAPVSQVDKNDTISPLYPLNLNQLAGIIQSSGEANAHKPSFCSFQVKFVFKLPNKFSFFPDLLFILLTPFDNK